MMLRRLAKVIWWTTVAIGLTFFALTIAVGVDRPEPFAILVPAGFGVLTILFGRAVVYIICGE